MISKPSLRYKELLLEDMLALPESGERELERVNAIWNEFLKGERKTLGVENIYPILLDIENQIEERDNFLRLKVAFKSLKRYADEGFRTETAKNKLVKTQEYSNEVKALRIYSILKLISFLGGYKNKTWITRKQLSIAGHISDTSIANLCEALYLEKFIQKQQEPKYSESRGSISYTLTKKGKETIGKVDSVCSKIDREVWQGFKYFVSSRLHYLSDYFRIIEEEITYDSKDKIKQEILYSDKKIEPSRGILGEIGNKLIIIRNK